MNLIRVLFRLALLALVAAAFVGLTAIYGSSVRPPLPYARFQAAHRHRPPEPQLGRVTEVIGEGLLLALFAVGGRVALRLRLNPAPSSEGKPILLGLDRDAGRVS